MNFKIKQVSATIGLLFLGFAAMAQFGPENPITHTVNYVSVIASADINADGLPDVLATSSTTQLLYFKNNGGGLFEDPIAITSNANSISEVSTGDLNNDGIIDIVLASMNDDKIS